MERLYPSRRQWALWMLCALLLAALPATPSTAITPLAPCTLLCYVDGIAGADSNDGSSPATAKRTIQAALNQVAIGGEVLVAPATYHEDVRLEKASITLRSSTGPTATIISGVPGGNDATVRLDANTTTLDGFTITSQPAPDANLYGIKTLAATTGQTISNTIVVGNHTGLALYPSQGLSVANNRILLNWRGIHLAPASNDSLQGHTDYTFTQNEIAHNRTFGMLIDSAVTNLSNLRLTNNALSGNWASQLENNSTQPVDASGNWWGLPLPPRTTTSISAVIAADPATWAFPSPALPPAAPFPYTLSGSGAQLIDATPALASGADTAATPGFQGDLSRLYVSTQGQQTAPLSRIQEAIALAPSGGTVTVAAGSYAFNAQYVLDKPLTLVSSAGTYAVPPADQTLIAGSNLGGTALRIAADDVTIQGFVFTYPSLTQGGGGYIAFDGATPRSGVRINANLFAGMRTTAIDSLDGTPNTLSDVEIRGNAFTPIDAGTLGSAIRISAGTNASGRCSVCDNAVDGMSAAGITITGGANLVIARNHVSNIHSSGLELTHIATPTGTTVIAHNRFTDTNGLDQQDLGALHLYQPQQPQQRLVISCNVFAGGYNGLAFRNGQPVGIWTTIIYNNFSAASAGYDLYGGSSGGLGQTARYNYNQGLAPTFGGSPIFNIHPYLTEPPSCDPGVVPSTSTLALAEGGAAVTYTLMLERQPTAPVALAIAAQDHQSLVSLDGTTFAPTATLTIMPSAWTTPHTVTVRAHDDALVEGLHPAALTHTVAPTSAAEFLAAAPLTLTLDLGDNDSAGALVVESAPDTHVIEGSDATDAYSLTLSARPNAPVIIVATAANQVALSANNTPFAASATLAFTPQNWDQPQLVTLRALDDATRKGDHTALVSHVAASADPAFNGVAIPSVTVHITDDERLYVYLPYMIKPAPGARPVAPTR